MPLEQNGSESVEVENGQAIPQAREILEVEGPLVAPLYDQSEPNVPIDLGTVRIEFGNGNEKFQGHARVEMQFAPNARLSFTVPVSEESPFFAYEFMEKNRGLSELVLLDKGTKVTAFCTFANQDHLVFHPCRSPITISSPSSAELKYAVFHVFNFPNTFGPGGYVALTGTPPFQARTYCGRIVLKAEGWLITLFGSPEASENAKALKANGGYFITQMGKIERQDGAEFSGSQLEDVMHCLNLFVSFAMGRWTGLALSVGFDAKGNRAYEQWGLPRAAAGSWNGSCSWFDEHHGETLTEVFPGFFVLWNDDTWSRPVKEILYWYLAANDRGTGIGVDAGIILAQAALERLAWTYCVEDRKLESKSAFKGLTAAKKIRRLTEELGIPVKLPADMEAISEKSGQDWKDAADALIWVRNDLVHPERAGDLPDNAYYETWRLSMWLLDLLLLRLCGHNGAYANRLAERWVGQVEQVPWAMEARQEDREGPDG